MFKLLCNLYLLILVTSNPLKGLTSCPVIIYQHKPEVPSTQASNFNPYQQQHIVQNQLAPSYQTIPHLYSDQIRGLYLDGVLSNPSINSFVDPNSGLYDQNGYKITSYVTNPAGAQPSVVNNYIIVPPEYLKLNQSIANELQSNNGNENHRYFKVHNHKENVKNKREERRATDTCENKKEHGSDNHEPKVKGQSKCQVDNKKRKSSKNKEKKNNILESPKVSDEYNVELKPKKHRSERSKKALDNEINKKIEEYMPEKGDGSSKRTEKTNKKSKSKRRRKSDKKAVVESQFNELEEEIKSKDKPNDVVRNRADVEVGFDINEDCACLANRRTRNNCCQPKNNYNQCYPRDSSGNIFSYLNNFMSNPQFGANYFNPFVNFPYNFNYLYQMPQQPSKSDESNKMRKNKRKKQKSNKGDTRRITVIQNSNNKQDQEVTSNHCKKVIELEPQFIEIEETNEPPISKEITMNLLHPEKLVEEVVSKENEIDQNVADVPDILYADDDPKETLFVIPIVGDDFPILTYNNIIDEYYPDFTSDNTYLSKEEYECNNFNDKYYYTSDNKAEMSRERRTYEREDGKETGNSKGIVNGEKVAKYINNEKQSKCKNNVKNIEDSSEVRFLVPPPLEFPDFKTERVNKDRFDSRDEIYYYPDVDNYSDYRNSERNYGDVKEFNVDINKHHDNEVETIFAQSKVVRYGAIPSIEEKPIFDFTETRSDDVNLFSNDGETTVILARSLSFPEND